MNDPKLAERCLMCGAVVEDPNLAECPKCLTPRAPRRLGRPTKPPTAGERIQIGVQVTPNVKARLDGAAEGNHRSLSREAELRLERSFDRQDLLSEALSLNYGKDLAGMLMLLGSAMLFSGYLHSVGSQPFAKGAWTEDPDAYEQAVQAATMILEAMRPEGARSAKFGRGPEVAIELIKAVRGDPDAAKNPFTEDAPTIRSLLGSQQINFSNMYRERANLPGLQLRNPVRDKKSDKLRSSGLVAKYTRRRAQK